MYIRGFSVEFAYPNHKNRENTLGPGSQDGQRDISKAVTKNGSQHTKNTPVMMASVFAALRSLWASTLSRVLGLGVTASD